MYQIQKKSLIFLILICFSYCIFAESNEKQNLRYVSADSIAVKQKPSVRAKQLHTLSYADVVIFKGEQGNWSYVIFQDDQNIKGWVNTSALSKRKIVANGRERFMEADEIALAGKGLDKSLGELQSTSEVDEFDEFMKFLANNSTDENGYYSFLESIDSSYIDEQDLYDFIEAGKLSSEGY